MVGIAIIGAGAMAFGLRRKQTVRYRLMSNATIPFPAQREPKSETRPALDLPDPRIWKPKDLAKFLSVSVDWVYRRTGPSADDPIPRANMRLVRFDTHSREFQGWLARQLGYVDIGESHD